MANKPYNPLYRAFEQLKTRSSDPDALGKLASTMPGFKSSSNLPAAHTMFLRSANPASQQFGAQLLAQTTRGLPNPPTTRLLDWTNPQRIEAARQRDISPGELFDRGLANYRYTAIKGNWPNLGAGDDPNYWTPARIEQERKRLARYPDEQPLSRQELAQWRLKAIEEYGSLLRAGEDPGNLRDFMNDRFAQYQEERRLRLTQPARPAGS